MAAQAAERLAAITQPVEVPQGPIDEDGQLLEFAESVPGFAGMWSDGTGAGEVVTVALTAQGAKAMTADQFTRYLKSADDADLRAVGAAEALRTGAPVEVVEATYSFAQLKKWQNAVADALAGELVFSDADERNNTVTVGVSDEGAIEKVRARAIRAGVPEDAIRVVHAEFHVTLRDDHRPIAGGQQIQFAKPIIGDIGTSLFPYSCTLGVNGRITNLVDPLNGYFTNSHCSIDYASVDYVYHWQPTISWGGWDTSNRIGYEVIDPPFYTGNPYSDPSGSLNCPSGYQCRMSDAGFGMYDTDYAGTSRGHIARPSPLNDHSAWDGTSTYRITAAGAPTGAVRAVGRTSGMSTGTITHSCVRIDNIAGMPGIAQNCTYIGTYSSEGGDSGGPVFRVTNSPSTYDVTFVGLNWGAGAVGGSPVGIASSWPLMQVEFAPYNIAVCQSSFSC